MHANRLRVMLLAVLALAVSEPADGTDNGPFAPEKTGPRPFAMLSSGELSFEGEGAGRAESAVRPATPTDLVLSGLLPGVGELRTGRKKLAFVHMAVEAAVWATFTVFRVQGGLRKDDYIEYAEVFAGVQNGEARSSDYYRYLAKYRRSDPGPGSYNENEVRETARALFPDDPDARERYIEENEITGALAWYWESDADWITFRGLRESSELSYQRSRFAIGAAVANRIASVLGLARTRGPGGSTLSLGVRPSPGGEDMVTTVSLRKSF